MAERAPFKITTNLPPGMYVKPDIALLLKLFPEIVAKVLCPKAIEKEFTKPERMPCNRT